MAAGEDQLESFIGENGLVHRVVGLFADLEQPRLRGQNAFAADPIDRPPPPGGDQPRARRGRDPVARPAFRRDRERLLGGLLGEVEIAEEAAQGSEDITPLVAEDPLESPVTQDCCHSWVGRISIAPPIRVAGIRAATSIAASRSSASNVKKPSSASLVSTNGPSVVSVLPS